MNLEDDFYVIAWLGHLKVNKVKYGITSQEQMKNFSGVCFVFLVQFIFIMMAIIYVRQEKTITQCTYLVLIARFLASILLHIKVEGEFKMGLAMCQYFIRHRPLFD